MFFAWDSDWSTIDKTFTDADGRFALERPGCLARGGATRFGWSKDLHWLGSYCPAQSAGVVEVDLGDFTIAPREDLPTKAELAPPSTRRTMCLTPGGTWVDAL